MSDAGRAVQFHGPPHASSYISELPFRCEAEFGLNMASSLSRIWRWAEKLMNPISASQRTEITLQTEQVFLIRRRQSCRLWCEECGREVDVVGLQDVGKLMGTTQPALSASPVPEAWHVCAGQDGEPFICWESVLKSL